MEATEAIIRRHLSASRDCAEYTRASDSRAISAADADRDEMVYIGGGRAGEDGGATAS
jgi:hypothetical protein